jgi:cation diffusion facilitator CzcD-associated flavoprotein CzcO
MTKAPIVVVVGTGFAGFGAGHRLEAADQPYVVYDRNAYVGGHTASHELPGASSSTRARTFRSPKTNGFNEFSLTRSVAATRTSGSDSTTIGRD